MCSCVVIENSLQKSRGCVWPEEASAINPIRGRERGPSRDNRVCEKQHGIVEAKGRSARPVGGKTNGAEQDRAAADLVPRRTRQASKGVGRRNVPLDGSRAGSRGGRVFTDLAAKRSRGCSDVWAAAKGFASRCICGWLDGRDTGSVDDGRGGRTTPPRSGEKQTPKRRLTRATSAA
jgi:hypothetical protein